MDRAYSILNVKSFREENRTFSGVATTPSVDRVGDIIEPLGVKFANPLPLLFHHNHAAPVGLAHFDKPTQNGINFSAEMPRVEEEGVLKTRLDEAWHSVRSGLIRAVSVGFTPIEYAYMNGGGVHYKAVEVLELSLVTVPAQSDAIISAVKSHEAALARRTLIPTCRVIKLQWPGG